MNLGKYIVLEKSLESAFVAVGSLKVHRDGSTSWAATAMGCSNRYDLSMGKNNEIELSCGH